MGTGPHLTPEMIERFDPQGFFSELDLQFARFMARLALAESRGLFLSSALTSKVRAEGNICLDLSSMAGKPLPQEGMASLICPDLSPWLRELESLPVVGRPGEYRPLILSGSRLYLYRYWKYETDLAENLRNRAGRDGGRIDEGLLRDGLERLFPADGQGGTDWQKVAALTSVLKALCVIRG